MAMSKDEAIELLENLIGMVSDSQDNDYDTALKMAIEALENNDKLAEDLQNCLEMYKKKKAEVESLKQPQIIQCKDCKHYNKFIATLSKTGQAVWDEYCEKFRGSVTADDFCSKAERREEE